MAPRRAAIQSPPSASLRRSEGARTDTGGEVRLALRLFVGTLFLLVGAGALLGAFAAYKHERLLHGGGTAAAGVVVRLEERKGARGNGRSYAPVVRFSTRDGQGVEFTSTVSANPPAYSVGEPVRVLYDRAQPVNAELDSSAARWFGVVGLVFLGAVFSALGVYFLLPAPSRRRVNIRHHESAV